VVPLREIVDGLSRLARETKYWKEANTWEKSLPDRGRSYSSRRKSWSKMLRQELSWNFKGQKGASLVGTE
jgi:hypothetical protein